MSLFFARLDSTRKAFVYAAAGQNGHRFGTDGTVSTLEVTGPLLGVIDDPQPASEEIALQPGELVLLFTDGIAEATSPQGEQFGNRRIFETVRQHAGRSAEEILAAIVSAGLAFRGQIPIDDDVTMLIIQRKS